MSPRKGPRLVLAIVFAAAVLLCWQVGSITALTSMSKTGALYTAILPRATRLHRTIVHAEPEGDVWFPEVDWSEWTLAFSERHEADARHAHAFTFETFERRAAGADG